MQGDILTWGLLALGHRLPNDFSRLLNGLHVHKRSVLTDTCGKYIIDHEPCNVLVRFRGLKSHYDFLNDTYMWILKHVGGRSKLIVFHKMQLSLFKYHKIVRKKTLNNMLTLYCTKHVKKTNKHTSTDMCSFVFFFQSTLLSHCSMVHAGDSDIRHLHEYCCYFRHQLAGVHQVLLGAN